MFKDLKNIFFIFCILMGFVWYFSTPKTSDNPFLDPNADYSLPEEYTE